MKKIILSILLLFTILSQLTAQDVLDSELKKLADQLSSKLKNQTNKRIAVINFTNLENQQTALGRALAEMFAIELMENSNLILINRAQINRLIEENKMLADGFLDDQEVIKLGKMQKIDLVITGAATPLDSKVMITLQATDLIQGTMVGGAKGYITRSNAVESLMRDNLDGFDETKQQPSNTILPSTNNNATNFPSGDSQVELPIGKCVKKSSTRGSVFGEICLENRSGVAFEVYKVQGYDSHSSKMMVGSNSRNCYGLLKVEGYSTLSDIEKKLFPSYAYTFYISTTEEDEEKRKYGQIRITVDGCKITTRVIDKGRITFSRSKN